MKIAFFTTGMTRGGAERVIATVANRLSELGHEVSIIILKGDKSEYRLNERVSLVSASLSPGLRNGPAAMSFYRRAIREMKPEVVISFTLKANLMACSARRWLGIKAPLIVSERANPFQRKLQSQLICNNLFRTSDSIVCQSKVISCYYEGRVKDANASVIPNPIDDTCIADAPAKKRESYLLSVGRLCDQKRHDISIRALAELKKTQPDLRLRICGVGEKENGLRALSKELGVSDSVEFCGNVDNVMKEYADSVAYLMTSDYEGFPNALIEAMSSGIAVVSTDFSPGVARELVHDGVNGYVVSAGDPSAVANAVTRLQENYPSFTTLSESMHAVRDRFALDCVVEQWVSVCEQVIEGNTSSNE